MGVIGSLVGSAVGVAKAVNDNKAAQRQLDELKRHKTSSCHGVYFALYKQSLDKKSGQRVSMKKIKKIKKKIKRNDKNAKEYYYQHTTATIDKTYAYSIF